jgi:dTDP-L-oleandrosyltransferase
MSELASESVSAVRHVAVFSLPAYGHVYPTLAVVAELVGRGHRVSYLTTAQFADVVRGSGAEPVLYESDWGRADDGDPEVKRRQAEEFPLEIIRQSLAPVAAAEAHFASDRPDVVLYDGHLASTCRVLTRIWDRPGVQMWPTFASGKGFSLLMEVAKDMPAPAAMPEASVIEVTTRFAEFLAAHGLTDLPMDQLDPPESEGLYLAFLPREFQYEGDSFGDNFAFVGPCLADRGFQGAWQPPASGDPVLLIAMGTTGVATPDLFRSCVKAFQDSPWHVVLAVGTHIDPAEIGPLPSNVEVHQRVPQLDVLAHAQLFVSHAGMGSVMESLASGVPLVAAPHSAEQAVVGRRVQELGLGRMLHTGDGITAEDLREAVAAVAADEDVRRRVDGMRERIRAAGGAVAAADRIEARLGTRPNG